MAWVAVDFYGTEYISENKPIRDISYDKREYSYPLCYFVREDGTVDGKVVGNKFDKEE